MYGASVVIEIYHHCEQYVKFVTTYVVVAKVVFDKTILFLNPTVFITQPI